MTTGPDLKAEQAATLAAPRRAYGALARLLFAGMDLVYGRERTLSKFTVLEVIARVPYQAWEQVAYIAMTHTYRAPGFARRVFEFVKESRAQQDNEQCYYHVSWLLYVVDPRLSYALNADFEDHAEHEYMEFVRERPALETQPFESGFADDYGRFSTRADLLRRIGLDERQHKLESLARIATPRFS